MTGPRFLIVRLAGLGDIAVTSTVLARIRDEHPGAHVTWVCGAAARDLVSLFDGVDEIVTVDERRLLRGGAVAQVMEIARLWRRLAFRRFDTVLLYHAAARYRVLVAPVLAGRRLALRHGQNPRPNRFRGDEFARLLDGVKDEGPSLKRYALSDVRTRLPMSGGEGGSDRASSRPVVALVPGGARNVLRDDALRRWPVPSYAALARQLAAAGCGVVLVGGAEDEWVRSDLAGTPAEDAIGALDLQSTMALLRDCDVVVSHDTGPLHLARLVRTPVVALFGPTDPRSVVGDDPDVTWLWGGAHLSCRPCYDGRNYAACSSNVCIQSITVGEVFAAVMRRLDIPGLTDSGSAARPDDAGPRPHRGLIA